MAAAGLRPSRASQMARGRVAPVLRSVQGNKGRQPFGLVPAGTPDTGRPQGGWRARPWAGRVCRSLGGRAELRALHTGPGAGGGVAYSRLIAVHGVKKRLFFDAQISAWAIAQAPGFQHLGAKPPPFARNERCRSLLLASGGQNRPRGSCLFGLCRAAGLGRVEKKLSGWRAVAWFVRSWLPVQCRQQNT